MTKNIRNIAIIAHVDHGKTTLVDAMLRQSGIFRANQELVERVMDSNDLERERGITILAKNTAHRLSRHQDQHRGHAGPQRFWRRSGARAAHGGWRAVLVDASEGPLPQTRYVLQKALAAKLPPIMVLNKIDRADARPAAVLDEIYDLFIDLDATEDQLDFPVIYTNAQTGRGASCKWAMTRQLCSRSSNRSSIPFRRPRAIPQRALQIQVTNLDYSDFLGRVAIARVFREL